jgi:predicted  nucleic acid-binding Zn-ribbon protein
MTPNNEARLDLIEARLAPVENRLVYLVESRGELESRLAALENTVRHLQSDLQEALAALRGGAGA